MSQWRNALKERLAPLELRPEREAEIIDELSQHLDDQVRELVAGGTDAALACAEALAELDAPGALARRLADIESRPPLVLPPPGAPSRGRFLHARWQDIRHSVRALRRAPIFAITVLATFALTIGPTTAILSFGNWLLWRPTPGVHQPNRLAVLLVGQWTTGISTPTGVSYANLQDLRKASKTLTGIAGLRYDGNVSVAGGNLATMVVTAGLVTADMFDVLGVPVIAGRPFRADDDLDPRGERVVLLSETLARKGFGDASRAINQQVLVNGRPLTIIGVLPERFAGLDPMRNVGVWIPGATHAYVNHFDPPDRPVTRADGSFYTFVVRLAPQATFDTVKAELDVLIPALADRYPDENSRFRETRARVFPGLGPSELQRTRFATNTQVLLMIGGTLLLLGCLNVANVLMVRSVRTGRDRAVRLALGASRARLVMLQLTESGLLAAGGAGLGLLLAVWLKQLIVVLLFPEQAAAVDIDVPLDLRVLGWTLGVSLACGVLAGLVPALVGRRPALAASIAGGGRSVTGTQWLRATLASVQLAISLALIIGSLLLVGTLRSLNSVALGFDPANVTRHVVVDPARHGYTADRSFAYFQDLLSRLRSRDGIEAVSHSGRSPFGTSYQVRIQDPEGADRPLIRALSNGVSTGYFDVLRMKVVRGRVFTEAESLTPATATAVPVIVSESLGRRLFGEVDPVGRSFNVPKSGSFPTRQAEIIGVVGDVHWNNLTEERPQLLYLPLRHLSGNIVMVRSSRPPAEVMRIVEETAREVDASLPISFSQTMAVQIESEMSEQRMFAWMLSLVGWIAFALAAVGLYGLLAQSVSERTREFGIRLAVGSGRGRIFGLVLKQAGWIGFTGLAAGLALAAFGTRVIEAQLFGVARLDVTTYVVAAAALVVTVLVSGLWPARTATRIQPVEALRVD